MFKLLKKSKKSNARLGKLKTPHGIIETPFFMPIATKGSVKALASDEIKKAGAQIILSNTYHLYLQPGMDIIKKFKGLHNFMNWDKPILTDSGGYQVFSLGRHIARGSELKKVFNNKTPSVSGYKNKLNQMVKMSKHGVEFKSFLDGSNHLFTPEKVQQIQDILGSDIKMVLDVCSPYPCSKKQAEKDLKLTHFWAERSLKKHKTQLTPTQKRSQPKNKALLFAILQGSTYKDLRIKSAKFLSKLDFDGLAIGGLAVGEPNKKMYSVLDYLIDYLPENKPRYLMGVGKPENLIQAVKKGIDMFDCVIPTREARHGRLYVFTKACPERGAEPHRSRATVAERRVEGSRGNLYKIINISNSKFKANNKPPDKNCTCELCKNYSLGYLHHLFKAQEPLAIKLASLHNIQFYLDLFKQIRLNIKNNEI